MSSYWGHGGGDERRSSIRRSRQSVYERRASLPCVSQLEAVRLKRPSTPSQFQRREGEGEGEVRTNPHARRFSSDEYRGRRSGGAESGISAVPELTESFRRMLRFHNHRVRALSDPDNECLICHEETSRRARDTGRGGQEPHSIHHFHKEARRPEQGARPRSRSSATACESRKDVAFCSEQEKYRLPRQRWSLR